MSSRGLTPLIAPHAVLPPSPSTIDSLEALTCPSSKDNVVPALCLRKYWKEPNRTPATLPCTDLKFWQNGFIPEFIDWIATKEDPFAVNADPGKKRSYLAPLPPKITRLKALISRKTIILTVRRRSP